MWLDSIIADTRFSLFFLLRCEDHKTGFPSQDRLRLLYSVTRVKDVKVRERELQLFVGARFSDTNQQSEVRSEIE